MTYTLIDGVKRNAEHPDRFYIPSEAEKDALEAGVVCKVGVEFKSDDWATGERFWVRVTARDGEDFRGVVLNQLIWTDAHGLDEGNEIAFQRQHVIDIDFAEAATQ
jgi:uncharacterized protein YegJ (DUF2314 family)